MLKRECVEIQGVNHCQIPFDENGISGITNLVGLLALITFSGIAFFKLLKAFFG